MYATLTSKGQITLPKKIRDQLKLKPGDQLRFDALPDGTLIARPATRSADSIIGILQRPGRLPVSVEGIEQAIARHIRQRRQPGK